MPKKTDDLLPGLRAQRAYVDDLKSSSFKFGLTVGAAFVRGIRDIGYKSNGHAMSELVDNAHQATANRVHVAFGYEATRSDKKPTEIAIIDDGHGMEPDMIRVAAMWGGTHREGDRSGFGRYGYGLPCSCVSIGRRFTIYSKVEGGAFHAVTIDLDEISEGKYSDETGEIIVPPAEKRDPPKFARDHLKKQFPGGAPASGTVIVIEKLDRLRWKTAGALRENLLQHFGVTYHKLRHQIAIQVDDTYVDPIDPLFLTPGFRFFDLDADRAVPLDPLHVDVRDPETREVIGQIVVRYCYMPHTFASIDKRRGAMDKNANPRFSIMREFNGIIFSRMGRLIDVINRSPWTVFVNNDRYIGVEVEFPAALDEDFGITTAKQQISVSERIWNILKENGVPKAIEQLRQKVKTIKAQSQAEQDTQKDEKRPSEDAMEKARKMVRPPSAENQAKLRLRGEDKLKKEAEKRAAQAGTTPEEEEAKLNFELGGKLYKLACENMPGAPFFRVDQWGGTKMLFMNTAHKFYTQVYAGHSSNPAVRAALEVLLFSIGDCMLDASNEAQRLYTYELPEWSKRLELALQELAIDAHLGNDGDEEEPAWSEETNAAQ